MTTTDVTTGTARSRDGTAIGYERSGEGPAVVIVDGAGCHRANGPARPLAAALADRFTVVAYDRRGRGDSGDTPPYAVAREVEDLAAVVDAAGGSAFLYGISSGALLAFHAVAAGVDVPRLVVFEPPLRTDGRTDETPFTAEMAALVAAGRREAAVQRFLGAIVPPDVLADMADTAEGGRALDAFAAIAPTLVYDCRLSDATSLDVLARVTAPTLVLESAGSGDDLGRWAATAAEALPRGSRRRLEGGWHGAGVPDEVVADALATYLLT